MDRQVNTSPVELVSSEGRVVQGLFSFWDQSPGDPDQVRLDLALNGQTLTEIAETYFDALVALRRRLEAKQLRPKCYGACRNVYPSPMILSMGNAENAYQLTLGKHGRIEDLVNIFATSPEIVPVSVDEQEAFYAKWCTGPFAPWQ